MDEKDHARESVLKRLETKYPELEWTSLPREHRTEIMGRRFEEGEDKATEVVDVIESAGGWTISLTLHVAAGSMQSIVVSPQPVEALHRIRSEMREERSKDERSSLASLMCDWE